MTSGTTPQNHEPYPAYPSTDLPHTDPLPRPETPETAPGNHLAGKLGGHCIQRCGEDGVRLPKAKARSKNCTPQRGIRCTPQQLWKNYPMKQLVLESKWTLYMVQAFETHGNGQSVFFTTLEKTRNDEKFALTDLYGSSTRWQYHKKRRKYKSWSSRLCFDQRVQVTSKSWFDLSSLF